MIRFALVVTAVELLLTVLAVWFITLLEPPVAADYLILDDFRALGPVSDFRRDQFRKGACTVHAFWADIAPATHASAEIRLGAPRLEFYEQLRSERRRAERERPQALSCSVVEEQWSGSPAFIVRRSHAGPAVGDASVEIWICVDSTIVVARLKALDVPRDRLLDALHRCERHARSLGLIALGNVVEAASR